MLYTFAELRKFAETHAATREWIEKCKDELVVELGHEIVVRMIAEDLLVCGAVCFERNHIVDVSTILLLKDENGNTPLPPAPAYQQMINGVLSEPFSADKLNYVRLPKSGHYARGPIEQFLHVRDTIKGIIEEFPILFTVIC